MTEPLVAKLRGYASPFEPFDDAFLQAVTAGHAAQVLARFLDRYRPHLERDAEGLGGLLEQVLTAGPASARFSTFWAVPMSDIVAVLRRGDDPEAALAASGGLALHLAAAGLPSHWRLRLPVAVRLRWDAWWLPPAAELEVASDGRVANLRLRPDSSAAPVAVHLERGSEGWQTHDAEQLTTVQTALGQRLVLVGGEAARLGSATSVRPEVVETITPEMADGFQAALSLLGWYAPEYLTWIDRVLREVVVLCHDPRRMRSGTPKDQYGLIHAAAWPRPAPIAEMFVHESTHHYFHLASRLGPVDDGSDTKLYYSPAVGRERRLERILVAYHAFANVRLFYLACVRGGLDDGGYCARSDETLRAYVEQLAEPLRNNSALTAVGRALCEPLMERLAASPR